MSYTMFPLLPDVPCYVSSALDMVVCGGVEIQGLHATVAPRRGLQSPATLEEYCFVPYTQVCCVCVHMWVGLCVLDLLVVD